MQSPRRRHDSQVGRSDHYKSQREPFENLMEEVPSPAGLSDLRVMDILA